MPDKAELVGLGDAIDVLKKILARLDKEDEDTSSTPRTARRPCRFVVECYRGSPEHLEQYSHPCLHGRGCAERDDSAHSELYTHDQPAVKVRGPTPTECRYGAECTRESDAHKAEYLHPCPHGADCLATYSHGHMQRYTHEEEDDDDEREGCGYKVPCKYGRACHHRALASHAASFSHPCDDGSSCPLRGDEAHCLRYTHPCLRGVDCTDLESLDHCSAHHHDDVERSTHRHSRTITLYHQTKPDAAQSIVAAGGVLKPGSGGLFGPAIYFAESLEVTDRKALHKGVYLKASVRVGRALIARKPLSAFNGKKVLALGCDSVYAPGSEEPGAKGGERYAVHYTEYAVYYSTQVTDVEIVNPSGNMADLPQWALLMAKRLAQNQPVIDLPACPTPIYNLPTDTATRAAQRSGTVSGNPWNAFQKQHAGKGYSKAEMSRMYQEAKAATSRDAGTGSSGRRPSSEGNAWYDFQRKHAGQGYSKAELSSMYQETKAAARDAGSSTTSTSSGSGSSSRRPSSGGGNAWNDFQREHAGQGYSKAELSDLYQQSKGSSSTASSSASSSSASSTSRRTSSGGNPWNAFQQQHARQGYSRSEMSDLYQQSRASASAYGGGGYGGGGYSYSSASYGGGAYGGGGYSSGGGGNSGGSSSSSTPSNPWNAFQQAHAGQGLSRSQVSAMYRQSKGR